MFAKSYRAVLQFAEQCLRQDIETTLTAVDYPGADLEGCAAIAGAMGAGFRARGLASPRGRAERREGGSAMTETGARILLVDDEDAILKLLRFPLEKEGYQVVTAGDGEEALETFARETFDLVILDIMLPHVDGMEVCRRIRAQSIVPDHHAHRQVATSSTRCSASRSAPTTTSPRTSSACASSAAACAPSCGGPR